MKINTQFLNDIYIELEGLIIRKNEKYIVILDKLKKLDIDFCIGGSYALRHIRDINDLDILVNPKHWNKLIKLNLGIVDKTEHGSDVYCININGFKIEIHNDIYPTPYFAFDALEKMGLDMDEYGNKCWSVDQTIKWKTIVNRDKDKSDIKLLNAIRPKATVFVLPFSTRPDTLPYIRPFGKYWHTGIIYRDKVHECFSNMDYSISERYVRIKELKEQNAEFYPANIDIRLLVKELTAGTDCATFVGRVLNISNTLGIENDKLIWPDFIKEYLDR